MNQLRASVEGVIVSVLFKSLARRLARRARRQVADRARAAIVVPLEDLWQVAIAAPVEKATARGLTAHGLTAHGLDVAGLVGIAGSRRDQRVREDRHVVRGLLMALVVAVLVAVMAFVAAAILRSRRQPAVADTSAGRPVAIPVSVASSGHGEAQPGHSSGAELQFIKGIGPETARRLHDIGIHTIEQIATWELDDVKRIADRLGIPAARIEHEAWISQARAAGAGVGASGDKERPDGATSCPPGG